MEEIDAGQSLRLGIWKSILAFASPFRKSIAGLCLVTGVVAAVDALSPFLTGWAVDNIALAARLDRLPAFVALFLGLACVQALAVRVFMGLGGKVEMGMNYGIRGAAFAKLQALSFSYFDRTSAGWITARLTSDIGRLADIIAWGIIDMVWGLAMMVISAGLMFAADWRLALVALSSVPVLILVSVFFEKAILGLSREARRANSKLTAAYSENIRGVKAVKTLVAEERQGLAFRRLSETMRRASVRQAFLSSLYLPLVIFLGYIGSSLALWSGGLGFLGGRITLGLLSAFIFSVLKFYDPVTDLARVLADLQFAQASAERVLGLIEAPVDIQDSPELAKRAREERQTGRCPRLRGQVSFRGVSFSYDGKREVLSDFNLEVEAGKTIALVGETGSGKSTIVNLACRFYEPSSGTIFVDGVDYREIPLKTLHGNLGYVLQQPHLFSGSIGDNIRYGRLEAGEEEVVAAARAARAHDFIMGGGGRRGIEGGYEAQVGEGGVLLSTGQKQLISIARALLADPAILVLDEATSSVDSETEHLVQEALALALKGRTSFVIAHRLSTIVGADLILVLKDGRVVESGRHGELLAAGGYYRRLFEAQFLADEERELFGGSEEDDEEDAG